MTTRKRVAIVLLAFVVFAGACGSDGDDSTARPSATSTTDAGGSEAAGSGEPTSGASSGGERNDGEADSAGGPADDGTTDGAATGGGAAGASTDAAAGPVANIRLDKACVVRGSATDLQGFVADVGTGAIVIYSTAYSDGSNELSNPDYATGFGDTTSGPDGKARATWVVPGDAPTGTATLHVAGSVEMTPRELPFEVVSRKADCP